MSCSNARISELSRLIERAYAVALTISANPYFPLWEMVYVMVRPDCQNSLEETVVNAACYDLYGRR